MKTILVWFRNDLRLEDHPALHHAAAHGDVVVPVFIWSPGEEGAWAPGAAQQSWLRLSLQALGAQLQARGARLILRRGPAMATLRDLIAETSADALYWNRRHTPALQARDAAIAELFETTGIATHVFEAYLLHDPASLRTTSGGPYHVFTPFWNRLRRDLQVPYPFDVPSLAARSPAGWPATEPLDALGLARGVPSAGCPPGTDGARERLERFLDEGLEPYAHHRDFPGRDGTSGLSPYLHHGEISPRQLWHAVASRAYATSAARPAEAFLRQLAWREFSYHLLHHYPASPAEPLRDTYRSFPWRTDDEALERWRQGRTGYPFIDAGMRQLRASGWMHNRARMAAASFLTKHLLLPWQEGARWFWETLVDADLACNTTGWQWTAGCGADAQPFFRIFNPTTQGTRFDPDGTYVRRWVPELRRLPDRYLHRPWKAPRRTLDAAGIVLGRDYPAPMVDHDEARHRALAAYRTLR